MASSRRITLRVVLLTLALAVAYLLAGPSPIDPAAYSPEPAREMTGPWAANERLAEAELLARGRVQGPEDVAVDAEGRIYGGTVDGRIVRLTLTGDPDRPDGERLETYAETGGRPLGLHFDAAGRLIVAVADKGLLAVDRAGEVELLADRADAGNESHLPFAFTDDLDIASDGTIYFTDASSRYGAREYLYDLLEARPHGRLLAHDPATGETRVLLSYLYFANGVALSENEDFVLVNETYRYRIIRYWLKGPRAGENDVFADRLPGFPDGIAADRRGTFWAAFFTVRNPLLDRLHPRPWAKSRLALLPKLLWPKPAPVGLVAAFDEEGNVLCTLQDPDGEHIHQITSAQPDGAWLYLGTLEGDWIGRVEPGDC